MVCRVGDWSPPSLSRSAGACGWRRYPQKEIRCHCPRSMPSLEQSSAAWTSPAAVSRVLPALPKYSCPQGYWRTGQKSVSSEDLRESPQRQKECKEVLSSRTPSVILSQKSEFQEESQLFTHLHLAEMEKVFEDDIHSPAVALIVSLDCSSFLRRKPLSRLARHHFFSWWSRCFLILSSLTSGTVQVNKGSSGL
ncbi:uncharacterized protein [Manis javanica]|uniref:uncharacterized protein isoform X4 n=1 Tax=Manis javanica TaxID=9974 RepID=UPI003C6CEE0A